MKERDPRYIDLGSPMEEIDPSFLGGPEEALETLLGTVFPALDMAGWVSRLVSALDLGEVASFSSIARGLGDPRAARAIAELISKGKVRGPVHRVVYSDGTPLVPEDLLKEVSEMDRARHVEFRTLGPLRVLAEIQKGLSLAPPRHLSFGPAAGIDVSYDDRGASGALCVIDGHGDPIGNLTRRGDPLLPYIPGYLFYREAPVLLPLMVQARDSGLLEGALIMVDGNGRLHPRRAGIACHLGVLARSPTCGVAKRLMMGSLGDWTSVGDIRTSEVHEGGERLGTAIARGSGRPIYVSEGNMVTLDGCVSAVMRHLGRRLPVPLLRAHHLANEDRRIRNRSEPS